MRLVKYRARMTKEVILAAGPYCNLEQRDYRYGTPPILDLVDLSGTTCFALLLSASYCTASTPLERPAWWDMLISAGPVEP